MGACKVSRRFQWRILLVCALCLVLVEPIAAHLGHDHGDDEDTPTTAPPPAEEPHRSSKVLGNKGGALVVFFMVPFLMCLIPYFIRLSEKVLVYGMLFGVGLFFTLALEHLVGGSADSLKFLRPKSTYPLAYCLVALGYMLTFLMDLIVHDIVHRPSSKSTPQGELPTVRPSAPDRSTEYMTSRKETAEASMLCCKDHSPPPVGTKVCLGCVCKGSPCVCNKITPISSNNVMLSHSHVADVSALPFAEVLLLVLALSFHAIFEGLVIGLSGTVSEVWKSLTTIIIHKIFEGLALGMSLMIECPIRTFLSLALYAFGFAISGPVGVAIGMILDRTTPPRTSLWADAIGNAFAAGVFIFVALNHLLIKGMKPSPKDSRLTPFFKWFAVALGFVTMSLIQLRGD